MITPSKFYSENFNKQISEIKSLINQNKLSEALNKSHAINEKDLISNSEKAQKFNIEGLILFNQNKFEESLKFFTKANELPIEDEVLTSQINLNLASVHFKLNKFESAYKNLQKVDNNKLISVEEKNYYQLYYLISLQLGKKDEAINAMMSFLKNENDLTVIRNSTTYEQLKNTFSLYTEADKVKILDRYDNDSFVVAGLLAYEEAEKEYLVGKNEESKTLAEWIKKYFNHHHELNLMAENFLTKFNQVSPSVSKGTIGIILPLSGKKSEFSERAMKGLDCALAQLFNNPKFRGVTPKLLIRDSKGSGLIGAYQAEDLIEKNNVSIIIGGLFPEEAEEEYLVSKKHQTVFISLSTLMLEKEKKDQFLVEIPGSVESQIYRVLSDDFLNANGKKVSIIYPNNEKGKIYFNEFWRQASLKGITITGVQSIDKDLKDVRKPIQNLLGLEYTRERIEELELLSNIYKLEQNKNRRVQTLTPKIDYDWIFMPLLPTEALQVIPAFSYFDAFGTTFVGDASWRTTNFIQGVQREKKIFFIGDKNSSSIEEFKQYYLGLYKDQPKLVETFAYESIKVIFPLLTTLEVSKRNDIVNFLVQQKSISGISGQWKLLDNVWIKEMNLLNADRGNIKDFSPAPLTL